jgi:hypothetical protein
VIGWLAEVWTWLAQHRVIFGLVAILIIVAIVVLLDIFGSESQ